MKYQYVINGIPRTKKNSQQMIKAKGRWIPIPSKAFTEYQKNAWNYLRDSGIPVEPISTPITIKCTFVLPLNKDGSVPKKMPDLTNLLEAIDDILVHYKLISDDNVSIIKSHDGSRVYYKKDEAYTIIEITDYEEKE